MTSESRHCSGDEELCCSRVCSHTSDYTKNCKIPSNWPTQLPPRNDYKPWRDLLSLLPKERASELEKRVNEAKKSARRTAKREIQREARKAQGDSKVYDLRSINYEIHHIIPIKALTTAANELPSLKHTTWCVNSKENLTALPKWPHTITWYYTQDNREDRTQPPPFENHAQHDFDHYHYIRLVNTLLKVRLVDKDDGCSTSHESRAKRLDSIRDDARTRLEKGAEGKRETHKQLLNALNEAPAREWYVHFSMSWKKTKMAKANKSFASKQAKEHSRLLQAIGLQKNQS